MIKRLVGLFCYTLLTIVGTAQTVSKELQTAFAKFEADGQLKHAISSLYVIDAKTGKVVFEKNAFIGLAPASTQKIITAATAFELLGKDYRYKTAFGIDTDPEKNARIWIRPSGDPTLGSWRWEFTKEQNVLKAVAAKMPTSALAIAKGTYIDISDWPTEPIPDGWIWQDIGNYYGAGAGPLNWHENQYDLYLKSGSKVGDPVEVVDTDPPLEGYKIRSLATAAAKGSGDNAYIYLPNFLSGEVIVRGTIPVSESRFKISGSMINPMAQFTKALQEDLGKRFGWKPTESSPLVSWTPVKQTPVYYYTHQSPPLDSIVYWFLKKSINLYGEALIKTFAVDQSGVASTDSGVSVIRKFWKQHGIGEDELNISDGSGLSPLNRVTTHAQVEVLRYAKTKDWFPYYYNAFPEYNGMRMKSGTISDVKGFCGYHTAKDGKEYIFSFLVNNYNGRSSELVKKMYKVLDVLK